MAVPDQFGFNIWTKNLPQPYLHDFVQYAEERKTPITAVVDDILPTVIFNRGASEAEQYSTAYKDFMLSAGYADVHFVSDLIDDRDQDLLRIVEMGSRIGLSTFMGLLPETKLQRGNSLTLTETIDTCWQLGVLEAGVNQLNITTYLTGKRSTALFRLAKNTIQGFNFETID